ncbi:HAMP domain-containing histidine kinase [Gordonia sp. X0973]|uniref:HAMP domain-containing sensor histidine kinase n=1 Tax=Gordonia sp. X0973 TaxID=2742602 RepID=UPI000F5337BA|nr:HAMP domain-containing sensor histidine kinase [Gordonia sp. X0973]QKT06467.1 HAMP domain-containing histidine kinase [Gordonia sp. X0973]
MASESSRWAPSRWSLQTRLIVGQVLLLALVCVAIGAATELALRHYLVAQLDDSLHEVSHRSMVITSHPPPEHAFPLPTPSPAPPRRWQRQRVGPGPEFLDAPSQPAGLVALVHHVDDSVSAGALGHDGNRNALSDDEVNTLLGIVPGAPPQTKQVGDRGTFRIMATTTPAGDAVVTGLPLSDVNETMWTVLLIMTVVALVALLAAAALGAWITRRALAPLDRMSATARQVASLPLDRGAVALPMRVPETNADPGTEVGQMGAALNRMLDHIGTALNTRQDSEMRARQFVADASHELRTPLAAIRGYTELAARRRDEVPDEVAHAMTRVGSESARMTHLVEDLLLLARLDSGRPLEQEDVDLSELAADAVSDAHVAGPDRQWLLTLPDDPVVVTGDSARLHQVLANLLANARVHTGPGTVISVDVAESDGEAIMRVADNGPGIDPALAPEVFTRFTRGDTSRSRKAGSTGLGLSIVDAVVKAHHGTIGLQSEPGSTVFTVRLPLATTR